MKKSLWYGLSAVILVSLFLRSIPLFRHVLWGMDYGEYVYYTSQWISSGASHLCIDGWANAYPFFPGMFILGGSVYFSGVPLFIAVQIPTLLLSSAVPLVIFILTHRITQDERMALMSAGFLAVLAPFVYNYSQPKPETLGFFLMLLILLMSMMISERKQKIIFLMLPASVALAFTHHFSSYFLILFLLGGSFMSVLLRKTISDPDKYRLAFFIFFTTTVFIYWLTSAPPFREGRLLGALGLPSYSILIIPYAGAALILLLPRFIGRLGIRPDIDVHKEGMVWLWIYSLILIVVIFVFLTYMYLYSIPGRDIELGSMVFYYIPLAFFGVFIMASSKFLWAYREGPHLFGWILFVSLSFLAGVITGSSSLLPMRQFAFLMMPSSILFGIGILRFTHIANPFGDLKKYAAISAVILLLFAWNIPLIYPSQDMTQGYTEATNWGEVEGGHWIRSNVEGRVAAEHRLSSAIFAVGYTNLTWTDGRAIYFSQYGDEALEEAHAMDLRYIYWSTKTLKGVTAEEGAHPDPFEPDLLEFYRQNLNLIYMGEETEIYAFP